MVWYGKQSVGFAIYLPATLAGLVAPYALAAGQVSAAALCSASLPALYAASIAAPLSALHLITSFAICTAPVPFAGLTCAYILIPPGPGPAGRAVGHRRGARRTGGGHDARRRHGLRLRVRHLGHRGRARRLHSVPGTLLRHIFVPRESVVPVSLKNMASGRMQ